MPKLSCNVPGCDRTWDRDPCLEVECPTCNAPVGRICRQPSGHNTWNAWGRFHDARDLAADKAGAYGPCPFGRCGNAPGAQPPEPEAEATPLLALMEAH
jgi:hypothetical protein